MASIFKKAFKQLQKIEKRLPAPAKKLAAQGVNPARSTAQFLSEQSDAKTFTEKREAFRRQHQRITTPFSHTANVSRKADAYLQSSDPNVVAEGERLRGKVNAATLKQAAIGASIGLAVSGAKGAVAAAGKRGIAAASEQGVKGLTDTGGQVETPGGTLDWNSIAAADSPPAAAGDKGAGGVVLLGVMLLAVKLLATT